MSEMTKMTREALASAVADARDEGRPTIETVLEVCHLAFGEDPTVVNHHSGPDIWMWEDVSVRERGLNKFYTIGFSTAPDSAGYPLLTIRQSYSLRLDTFITTSQLLIGPDFKGVARSVALAIANHTGAFAGFRHAVCATVAAGGDPNGGIKESARMMAEDDDYLLSSQGLGDLGIESESTREVDPKDAN